jgi:chemotaxis protein CheD
MIDIIKVGMADLNTTYCPGVLTTLGLGSCVGICLYDVSTKISGLVNIMLPSSLQIKNNSNEAKFADTGIVKLMEVMIKMGANRRKLISKIAGGAQMFNFNDSSEKKIDSECLVKLSKDKMKAYIFVTKPIGGKEITKEASTAKLLYALLLISEHVPEDCVTGTVFCPLEQQRCK